MIRPNVPTRWTTKYTYLHIYDQRSHQFAYISYVTQRAVYLCICNEFALEAAKCRILHMSHTKRTVPCSVCRWPTLVMAHAPNIPALVAYIILRSLVCTHTHTHTHKFGCIFPVTSAPCLRFVAITRPYMACPSKFPRPMTLWHTPGSLRPFCMPGTGAYAYVEQIQVRLCSIKSARKALVPGHHGVNSYTYTFRAWKQLPHNQLLAYHSCEKGAPGRCLHDSIQRHERTGLLLTCSCEVR